MHRMAPVLHRPDASRSVGSATVDDADSRSDGSRGLGCFGDFYTRDGLALDQRELLVLCTLATLGGTETQLRAHAEGNVKAGNSKERQLTALIHGYPYIGFPRTVNAIRAVAGLPGRG